MKLLYVRSGCIACEEAKAATADAEVMQVGPGSGHVGTMNRLELMSVLAMADIPMEDDAPLPILVEDDVPYEWKAGQWVKMQPQHGETPEMSREVNENESRV